MNYSFSFPYDVKLVASDLEELIPKDNFFRYRVELPERISKDLNLMNLLPKCSLLAELNCSATIYRECIVSESLAELIIEIPKDKVYDRLSLDILLLARESLSWDDQQLSKGMPLAHLGSFKIDLQSRAQGLISFVEHDKDEFKNLFNDNMIQVLIPKAQFDWLLLKSKNPLVKNLMNSQFAQLALIEGCQLMQLETYDHLLWQQELKAKWKSYSDQEKEFPESDEISAFVNHILKNPTKCLFDFLIQTDKNNENE
jgi:hypothetical protein